MFRGALIIACCWAVLTTAAPAPQAQVDAFAEDGDVTSGVPALGTFLQTLSTVTELLNRFSRTFTGPAQYNEFADVETAQPRVTLTEEKDASGGSIYKVTIVRPADSGSKFARQMESTTAAPPSTSAAPPQPAPTANPPAPAPPAPSSSPAPPPPSTTANPALVAAEVQRQLQQRITEIALQLEQEENRMEQEQERRELEEERRQLDLELAGRRAQLDLEQRRQEQERQLELEQERRELELEQALLNQERAVLGQLKAAPGTEAVADQTAAGNTVVTRIIQSFQSREDQSEERLLRELQRQNPHLQFVSAPRAPVVVKSAPITGDVITVPASTTASRRPILYGSPEVSLEDRLRYGAAPRLVQVGRNGAQPVYRFADSDEILYSTVHQPSQKATAAEKSAAPLVKQPLVVAPVALPAGVVKSDIEERHQPHQGERVQNHHHQSHHNPHHEMFSDEDEDQEDVSALSPLMFLLKGGSAAGPRPMEDLERRESLESIEDLNKSGNRLDMGEETSSDDNDEWREFQQEWHYHPQPPLLHNDMHVNRVFRTRNVDYHNPEAEMLDVQDMAMRSHHGSSQKYRPIK